MGSDNQFRVAAVILAAGNGSRMGGEITKQRMLLDGQSLLYRSVMAFDKCHLINSVVVVCREEELSWAEQELACFGKLCAIVSGGKSRAESAMLGFKAIPEGSDFVAIHDAARCLVTAESICEVVGAAFVHGAATASTPVTDTLKMIDSDGLIFSTVPREGMVCAQTPQVFSCDIYSEALYNTDISSIITDDNLIIEKNGGKIYPVNTGKQNIKITTVEDLDYAEYILKRRSEMSEIRIGHGYDVHRLVNDRRLVLGGVDIPFEMGLLGHSDADVLTHAIMDALLGACAMGDIGRHFPDNDDGFKDISSLELLKKVRDMLSDEGYEIVNIDATLVLQRPKVAPFIDSMIGNISNILGLKQGRINIKATTEEHLGFTGRGEGISAHAVASVKK